MLRRVPEAEGGWDSAERRTSAELSALGLDVEPVTEPDLSQCSDDATVRASIRRQGAIGAVELRRLSGARPSLRVCVVELVTGKAAVRHFDLTRALAPEQAAILAVELVHASLLEVRTSHPSRGQVPATRFVRREVDRQLTGSGEPWLGLRLGGSVFQVASGATLAPGVGLWLGLGRWVLDADGSLGITSASLASAHGSAKLRLDTARVHAELLLLSRPEFSLFAGLGGGFISADVRGNATAPYRSASGVATAFLGSTAVAAAYGLSRAWWVRVDAHAGYCPTPLEVTFADGASARVGRPLLDAGLYLEWRPF